MRWPWTRPTNTSPSVQGLQALYFNPGNYVDLAGITVNEQSALGLSALFRAVSLISGTLASLPLRSLRTTATGPVVTPSVFDDPDGPDGQTTFEWKESLFAHLVIHGKAGAMKVRNVSGSVIRLPLVHPCSFWVELPTMQEYESGKLPLGGLWFRVQLASGTQVRLDANDFWYVPALAMTPGFGQGVLSVARNGLGAAMAADRASVKMFTSGALISGLATPDDDQDITDDLPEMRRQLNNTVGGFENAGSIAIVNRRLKFTPWTMTAEQAQFLQSRQFQIEEISRWTGVPPHLLMQTDKQTSWGTGVDSQNQGMSKFVLGHWANRVEDRGSRLLANPRRVEFDFSALERPNYAVEAEVDLKEVASGVMTPDEYRAKRGRKPLPKAVKAAPTPEPAPAPDPEEDPDA